jgi:hypothetical protein
MNADNRPYTLKNTLKLNFQYLLLAVLSLLPLAAHAQQLNWEGSTGAFVTPFAYTAASPENGIGRPAVAYHYLNAGKVIGQQTQLSLTVGLYKRLEFGYTGSINKSGDTAGLSPLFNGNFNTFHGKLNLVSENAHKLAFLPAISAGFVARTQVRHVGGVINSKDTHNADFYLVATKTVTQALPKVPIVLNLGVRASNAAVYGIAGNVDNYKALAFGAVGFVLPGPGGSKWIVGSEAAQQPHQLNINTAAAPVYASLPTTLTYFVRILPSPSKLPLNIDFGVAQAAGRIYTGVDVKARAQFATGISYRF